MKAIFAIDLVVGGVHRTQMQVERDIPFAPVEGMKIDAGVWHRDTVFNVKQVTFHVGDSGEDPFLYVYLGTDSKEKELESMTYIECYKAHGWHRSGHEE